MTVGCSLFDYTLLENDGWTEGRKEGTQTVFNWRDPLSSVAEGVMGDSLKLNVARAMGRMVAVDG